MPKTDFVFIRSGGLGGWVYDFKKTVFNTLLNRHDTALNHENQFRKSNIQSVEKTNFG